MKLIVDKYEIPADSISEQIFRTKETRKITLKDVINGNVDSTLVYHIHEEEEDTRKLKYFFNEIVEIKNNLVYINKRRKVVKYYNIIKIEDDYLFKEIRQEDIKKVVIDKSAYLPHLRVQQDEVVIFPCEDEEVED
ncbi:hypothetical protein P3W45_001413 [Vairimorpha bombi]|jgi:hypothetical protein